MTTDAIGKEHRYDWSHQVSGVGTTLRLQRDQTLPLFAKGVACETRNVKRSGLPPVKREEKTSHKCCYLFVFLPIHICAYLGVASLGQVHTLCSLLSVHLYICSGQGVMHLGLNR